MCLPLFTTLFKVFPGVKELLDNLNYNRKMWTEIQPEDLAIPQPKASSPPTTRTVGITTKSEDANSEKSSSLLPLATLKPKSPSGID